MKKITSLQIRNMAIGLVVAVVFGAIGNYVGYGVMPLDTIPGMLILYAITLLGYLLSAVMPGNMPDMVYVSLIGVLMAIPVNPLSPYVVEHVGKVQLLAVVTPILAYSGLVIGRDWGAFRKLSWRAVIVGIVVICSTFFWSVFISELLLPISQGLLG